MDEVDKVLNVITDGTKNLELNTVDLLSESDVQKYILKNLIEVKYLLRQIIKKDVNRNRFT